MCLGPGAFHSLLAWLYGVRVHTHSTASGAGRGDEHNKDEEEKEGGAPVLKSKDPHLAGGEQTLIRRLCFTLLKC